MYQLLCHGRLNLQWKGGQKVVHHIKQAHAMAKKILVLQLLMFIGIAPITQPLWLLQLHHSINPDV